MATPWNTVYERFYNKIEKDADFFSYNNITDDEAIEIAKKRAKNYLIESISKLTLTCSPNIDFNDYDEEAELFNEDLTSGEIDLLASIMREVYFEKDLSLLKAFQVKFSTRDFNMFSPANERKSFIDMFDGIINKNNLLIKDYVSRDRLTGKLKTINFSQYSGE